MLIITLSVTFKCGQFWWIGCSFAGRISVLYHHQCPVYHFLATQHILRFTFITNTAVVSYGQQYAMHRHIHTVGHKKTCKFYIWDNFGKYGPILIILSPLQSVMNCRVSRYKISHLSLNLLLHYLAKLKCSKYIHFQQLFNSKVVQNPLSTVNI